MLPVNFAQDHAHTRAMLDAPRVHHTRLCCPRISAQGMWPVCPGRGLGGRLPEVRSTTGPTGCCVAISADDCAPDTHVDGGMQFHGARGARRFGAGRPDTRSAAATGTDPRRICLRQREGHIPHTPGLERVWSTGKTAAQLCAVRICRLPAGLPCHRVPTGCAMSGTRLHGHPCDRGLQTNV